MTLELPMVTNDSIDQSDLNTLRYRPGLCVNCGRCIEVCPHAVFRPGEGRVKMAAADRCMECGACQVNCPTGAIAVNAGVGCAAAMIKGALSGREPTCGPDNCC
jgi:NAD-dependent dihydropyrimidine dehydrogenase PreA subunit